MKQSEEILKHGYVTSGGGRAKVVGGFAHGTVPESGKAYVSGTYTGFLKPAGGFAGYTAPATQQAPVQQTAQAANNAKAASNSAKEFKETVDWVEVALDRIERHVSKMDTLASSIYRAFTDRNSSLVEGFAAVTEQIKYQEAAYTTYMNKANSLGVPANYVTKIQNGEWSIEDFTDEDLHKKVTEMQEWVDKAYDARDAIEELKVKLGELAQERFELSATKLDKQVDQIQHTIDMLDGQLDIIENRGNFAGLAYYEELVKNENKEVAKLQDQYDELSNKRIEALETGAIVEGSESDLEMIEKIHDVEKAWQDATNQVLEYKNAYLEMDTKAFTWAQQQIDSVRDESNFIQGLLSIVENNMFNKDTGRLNDKGMAAGSLHAMNYNVAMGQADEYRAKLEELNKAIAKDPTNTILKDQRDEYLESQRESIEAANDEKKAIQELISESYKRMLDILSKLIQKRKEALQAEKSLYDYEKNIKEQTKEINDLRKQMLSIEGDDSEEAKARRQQLSDSLKQAESDLEATEYDRWLSDQEQLMDKMYEEYERVLNERLDNIDGLLREVIEYANKNAMDVADVINKSTTDVGYKITDGLNSIWNNTTSGVGQILATYSANFGNNFTTVNKYIKGVFDILKETTKSKVTVDKPTTTAPAKPTPKPTPTPSNPVTTTPAKKAISVGGTINAGSAPIYNDSQGGVGPYGTHQYFASDPIYVVMKDYGQYILVRHHTQSSGAGFFRKDQVTALETGGYTGNYEGMALLHKKERVLNARQTESFDKLVYDMLPQIRENFMESNRLAQMSREISASNTMNGDVHVNISLPNVKNGADFVNELQNNKQFESLVQHMVFDGLTGKSSLRKNLVRGGRR